MVVVVVVDTHNWRCSHVQHEAAWTSGGNASGEPVRSSGRLYVIGAGGHECAGYVCVCVFMAMAMMHEERKEINK